MDYNSYRALSSRAWAYALEQDARDEEERQLRNARIAEAQKQAQQREQQQTLANRAFSIDERAFGTPRQTATRTTALGPMGGTMASPFPTMAGTIEYSRSQPASGARQLAILGESAQRAAAARGFDTFEDLVATISFNNSIGAPQDPELEAILNAWMQERDLGYLREKYGDSLFEDNFGGQFKASMAVGELQEQSNAAWAAYMASPTAANKAYAQGLDELQRKVQAQNKETLDEDASAPIISQDFAGWLPQGARQGGLQALGAGLGGLVAGPQGAKVGATAATGLYSYNSMKGAAFRTLLELGVDEETAKAAASDEALLSSMVEMGDTALTLFTSGANTLLNAMGKEGLKGFGTLLTKWAGQSAAKKIAVILGKYGINILGEGAEEGLQDIISTANQRRAQSGDTSGGAWGLAGEAAQTGWNAITGRDPEAAETAKAAAEGGMRLALLTGAPGVATDATGAVVQGVRDRRAARVNTGPQSQSTASEILSQTDTAPSPETVVAEEKAAADQTVNQSPLPDPTNDESGRQPFLPNINDPVYIPSLDLPGVVVGIYSDGAYEVRVTMDDGSEMDVELQPNEIRNPMDQQAQTPSQQSGSPEAQTPEGAQAVPAEAAAQAAPAAEASRVAAIPKEQFTATPAMDRLGIKVDGSVASYIPGQQVAENNRNRQRAQGMFRRRAAQLGATEEEIAYARDLASGRHTRESLNPDRVNMAIVDELAGLQAEANSFESRQLERQKSAIRAANTSIVQDVVAPITTKGTPAPTGLKRVLSKVVMNERQTERALKQVFGKDAGQKIYDTFFRSVTKNRAEKSRWMDKLRDRVRTFADRTGAQRALTPEERDMVQRLIEGQATVDAMEALRPQERTAVETAAKAVNDGTAFQDAVAAQQLQENEYLQGLVQAYADYMDLVKMKEGMDQTILDNAVAGYQQLYAELYEAMNDFLVTHGYQPLGFIKNYAPHFQKEDVQMGLMRSLVHLLKKHGDKEVQALPTSIAGRTADFKPNKKWNPHLLHREGNRTDYDIEYGFNQYLNYVAEMFFHTDDVMRLRAMEDWFRERYSSDSVSQAIREAMEAKTPEARLQLLRDRGAIKEDTVLAAADLEKNFEDYKDSLFERARPNELSQYSEFVTWLQDHSNRLAGKQSFADRGLEFGAGREALNFLQRLRNSFSTANIAGNLSSVLNQTSQLSDLQADLGLYLERAFGDLARGAVSKENFVEESDYLTDKAGPEPLNAELEQGSRLVRMLFKPAEMMDFLISTLAVRGRYLQALSEGMDHAAAMQEADDYGRRVMGSRGKGDAPAAFEHKGYISKMLHGFQLEASNTLDHYLTDLPERFRQIQQEKGTAAMARAIARYAATKFVSAFLLNSIVKAISGGSPAAFDVGGWFLNAVAAGLGEDETAFLAKILGLTEVDEDEPEEPFDWAAAAKALSGDVMDDVPYLQGISALMGWGDKTLPVARLDTVKESLWDAVTAVFQQAAKGEAGTGMDWGDLAQRVVDDSMTIASQFAPGGRQAQKTYQGIKTMAEGGKTSGYGDEEKLQYVVDSSDPLSWIQAALFGPSALQEAKDYYASEGAALSAKQTAELRKLEEMYDIPEALTYELVREFQQISRNFKGAEKGRRQREAISGLELDDYDKLRVYAALANKAGSTTVKYRAMLDEGLTWDQVVEAENLYSALQESEDLTATDRARRLEAWMDGEELTIGQRRAVTAKFGGQAAKGDDRYEYLLDRLDNGVPEKVVLLQLTTDQYSTYHKVLKPANVPAEQYLKALDFALTAESEKDKAGKPVKGKERSDKIRGYINGLRLNRRQKAALWKAMGYSSDW